MHNFGAVSGLRGGAVSGLCGAIRALHDGHNLTQENPHLFELCVGRNAEVGHSLDHE